MDPQNNEIVLQRIISVIDLCMKAYSPETFQHCKRVADYTLDNFMLLFLIKDANTTLSSELQTRCYILALCHDLLEDTKVTIEQISQASNLNISCIEQVLLPLTQKRESLIFVTYEGLREKAI